MSSRSDIQLWTELPADNVRSVLPDIGKIGNMQVVKVDMDILAKNMQSFLSDVDKLLSVQPASISGFSVDEIELNLAVNASGGIELVGKLTAGMQAGIKLKLKARK